MFLFNKYQFLKILNECPLMIQYLKVRPDYEKVALDTADWLLELFSYKHQYDRESLKMFELYPELFEDFIVHEIFEEDGAIEVVCPKGTNKNDRVTYELVTAFFLFFRHSKMLSDKEDFERNFEGAVIRFFSSLIKRLNSNVIRRQLNQLSESVREKFFKTSFVYNVSPRQQYTYNARNYRANDSDCVRLEINVVMRDDKNRQTTFGEYVKYLLLQERNRIVNFNSSAVFWNENVRLSRQRDPYLMEERPVADKDLLLFSLALALSNPVYDKLRKLRDETTFTRKTTEGNIIFRGRNNLIDSPFPFIDGNNTESALLELLDDSYWLLEKARNKITNYKDIPRIPRQILLMANAELLNDYCYPIISLEGSEIEETDSQVKNKYWRGFYNYNKDKNQLTLKNGEELQ